nr:MAG TPA: hypothetical protein [Caudoviricetes sp.]DAN63500.1 MAG TPA: hypothetical protein [Caudoviricetes sp.]
MLFVFINPRSYTSPKQSLIFSRNEELTHLISRFNISWDITSYYF